MDKMPEQHVAEVIVHQLGHVFLHALGDRSRGPVAEIRADKIIRSWGFDPFASSDWYHLHVKGWSRKHGPIWRAEPASRKELALELWDPQFPNWHLRYLDRRGRLVLDDWQVPY
jgi:hypothetical protein